MTDVDDLWTQIEEAKKRLGATDEAQIKQIQNLHEQVKEVRVGIGRRYRELERHHEDVTKLRHENEQLRRMLHRLLLAIEQRYNGRLVDLVKDLEGEVTALVPLTTGQKQVQARPVKTADPAKQSPADPAKQSPADPARQSPAGTAKQSPTVLAVASPSKSDSLWLKKIMERARELSSEDRAPPRMKTTLKPSQGARA